MGMATKISSIGMWRRPALPALRVLAVGLALLGMEPAFGGSWLVEPSVSISTNYSSNMSLDATNSQSGWTTDIAPGLRINGAGARINGFLDYRRDFLSYSANSQWDRQTNRLQSFANLEAIENWFYVDASANVVQRNLLIFAPTTSAQTSAGASLGETTTYQVAPYVRGRLFNAADYLLRLDSIYCRSDDQVLLPTRINRLVGSLKSTATSGVIGWFGDFNGMTVRNDVLGSRDDTRFRAGMILPLGARAHVSLSAGRENTDFAETNKESYSTPGVGFDWSPSMQTRIAALGERRFFGNGHNVVLNHSTPMTAWRYSDVRDVAVLPTILSGFNPGSIYELMSNLLEASIPDPLERSRAVRTRLDQLGGIAPLTDASGVQTSRFYIDRFQEASVALLGRRNTVTFVISQRIQKLPDYAPMANDNFSQYDTNIRQRVGSITWLHLLTPRSDMNFGVSRITTDGLDTATTQSSQTTATATLTVRLSPKAAVAFGIRGTRGQNTLFGSFHEGAVLGSLLQRF
jgi:uncharacterized protein (PEP-CTERM system associated)